MYKELSVQTPLSAGKLISKHYFLSNRNHYDTKLIYYSKMLGKNEIPSCCTSFENFEDALFKAPQFLKHLKVGYIPITIEEDGTYRYFGNGKIVFEFKPDVVKAQKSET